MTPGSCSGCEIDTFARLVAGRLREDLGYRAIQQIGPSGQQLLATARLAVESRSRIDSLQRLIAALDILLPRRRRPPDARA